MRLLLDLLPLRLQPLDVTAQLFLARALGRGAHDDARVLGDDLLRIFFSRVRSVSGSLRLMPVIEPSGT